MITKKTVGRGVFLLSIIIVFSLVFVPVNALGSQSFGNVNFKDDIVTKAEIEVAKASFPNPGILPDHPLYFLKRAGERVQIFLAFGGEEKAMLHLRFAKIRVAEAVKLAEENRTGVKETMEDFDREIKETASSKLVINQSDDVVRKSNIVLSLVLEKVPDKAKTAIESAVNRSIEKRAQTKAEIENKTPLEIREQVKNHIGENSADAKTNADMDMQSNTGNNDVSTSSPTIGSVSVGQINQQISSVSVLP